ncbi:MAG: M48 family metallopeptidase [Acidimicrobiales bacterium]|nr:M48 family metallopeptidase [Acidimicrobiales bacterium]
MANDPEAEFRESMYGHATNTPTAIHESTTKWLDTVHAGGIGFQARPQQPVGVVDLEHRAKDLAAEFGIPTPGLSDVRWARLPRSWGRCEEDNTILIADHAAKVPAWVLDSVIIHELAHLSHRDHGPEFEAITALYPYTDQAHGYILSVQDREWSIKRPPKGPRHV